MKLRRKITNASCFFMFSYYCISFYFSGIRSSFRLRPSPAVLTFCGGKQQTYLAAKKKSPTFEKWRFTQFCFWKMTLFFTQRWFWQLLMVSFDLVNYPLKPEWNDSSLDTPQRPQRTSSSSTKGTSEIHFLNIFFPFLTHGWKDTCPSRGTETTPWIYTWEKRKCHMMKMHQWFIDSLSEIVRDCPAPAFC